MTPVGHGALSYLVAAVDRRIPMRALVVGGVLPDIDFALVWAPQFNAWHRVVTHNLAFVVVAAVIGALVMRERRAAVALALAAGGLLHLLTDAIIDTNATNGIGIAIAWPFSSTMWSPFNLVTPAANPAGWSDPLAALRGMLRQLVWELPLWALAAVLLVRSRGRGHAR